MRETGERDGDVASTATRITTHVRRGDWDSANTWDAVISRLPCNDNPGPVENQAIDTALLGLGSHQNDWPANIILDLPPLELKGLGPPLPEQISQDEIAAEFDAEIIGQVGISVLRSFFC